MADPITDPSDPPKGGVSKGDFLKAHRTELLVGAAGLVVAIALYVKSRSSSSSGTSATTTPSTTDVPVEDTGTNGTGGGYGGELEEQIQALAAQLQGTTGAGTSYAEPAGLTLAPGGGYFVPGSSAAQMSTSGDTYDPVMTGQQEALIQAGGGSIFDETQPGVFQAVAPGQNTLNVPLYSQVPGGKSST